MEDSLGNSLGDNWGTHQLRVAEDKDRAKLQAIMDQQVQANRIQTNANHLQAIANHVLFHTVHAPPERAKEVKPRQLDFELKADAVQFIREMKATAARYGQEIAQLVALLAKQVEANLNQSRANVIITEGLFPHLDANAAANRQQSDLNFQQTCANTATHARLRDIRERQFEHYDRAWKVLSLESTVSFTQISSS